MPADSTELILKHGINTAGSFGVPAGDVSGLLELISVDAAIDQLVDWVPCRDFPALD